MDDRREEAAQRWGRERVEASHRLWNSYSQEKQAAIQAEAGANYRALAALVDRRPDDPEVVAALDRWRENLAHFYDPEFEVLRGLGQTYRDHPDFRATMEGFGPGLADFLGEAIPAYVEVLETRWLEQELNVLEE